MSTATVVGIEPPEGMRWANGGGSNVGECNGWHLAPLDTRGTICGRYGPHTIEVLPKPGTRICGNCARIAKIERILVAPHEHVYGGWESRYVPAGTQRRYCACGSFQSRPVRR